MKCPARGADTICRPATPTRTSPAHNGGNDMIGEEIANVHSETDQLREQLLRAQRLSSVGTLASSVAHEFNNILTTIINYAKLGQRTDCTDASKQQAFEKILK